MTGKPLRDLIVLLPGITGSVLRRNGKDVWAISGQATWQWARSLGASLQDLRLEDGGTGGVVADRLMPDAHIVPGFVKIDGYSALRNMIAGSFDIVTGSVRDARPSNYIEFPYDWRLDNRVTARQLADLIADRLPRWRAYSHNAGARVILIAHSMGGLVARYYLEVLEGWRDCRALITFGTPYRGSLDALSFLAHGYKRLLVDLTEVMRSFPSAYQLMPIYPALKVDGRWVRVAEATGVPGLDPARAQDALAFHREIETKVAEHCQDVEYRDSGYVVLPVVGTCQPTMQSAALADGHLTLSSDPPDAVDVLLADGDGTVPRASATPIELSEAYRDSFVPERHGSLQRNRLVLDEVRTRIEQMQMRGLREIRGWKEPSPAAGRPAIALDLDDLYVKDQPVILGARLVNAEISGPLLARVSPVTGSESGSGPMLEFAEGANGWTLALDGLSPGLFRVEVRTAKAGPWAPPPVHDLFEIGL